MSTEHESREEMLREVLQIAIDELGKALSEIEDLNKKLTEIKAVRNE